MPLVDSGRLAGEFSVGRSGRQPSLTKTHQRPTSRQSVSSLGGSSDHLLVVVVVRHDTAAAARWTSRLVVGPFIDDAIAIAIWASLHGRLLPECMQKPRLVTHTRAQSFQ